MKITDLYRQVTDRIVAELESGNVIPWLKPWKTGRRTGVMPINHATLRGYSGVNVLLLWVEREDKGYPVNEWLTFKQALDLGGHVKKGERSVNVIFARKIAIEEDDEAKLIPMMKVYSVFNLAQCEGLKAKDPEPDLPEHERNERAERFFEATKAHVRFGESVAAYIPSKDTIVMPARGAFRDASNLYSTLAHEHIHWSGAKERLNRELSTRFKSEAYAAEELVAELGAAFLCAHLRIEGELRHTGYIEDWVRVLKADDRAIFTAASKASQAANFLRAFSEEVVDAQS